jgi:hypothetical protein
MAHAVALCFPGSAWRAAPRIIMMEVVIVTGAICSAVIRQMCEGGGCVEAVDLRRVEAVWRPGFCWAG